MDALKPAPRNFLASLVQWLFDGYWPRDDSGPLTLRSSRGVYPLQHLLAVGDVADAYVVGAGEEGQYLLKVARIPGGCALLDNERKVLAHLLTAAGDTTDRLCFPELIESFVAADLFSKRVNVFRFEPEWSTLEAFHEQHPALDSRWVFQRLLAVLGFCHRHGIVHGAVLPPHVLVHAASQSVRLVGWGHSATRGRPLATISTRYRDWYPSEVFCKQAASPATDVFLAARCMVYLAGGDPVSNRMPDAVPAPVQRFLQSCLLAGARMRPTDLGALRKEWDELLHRLYGPPEFHELTQA
jgi:hypothetical protein